MYVCVLHACVLCVCMSGLGPAKVDFRSGCASFFFGGGFFLFTVFLVVVVVVVVVVDFDVCFVLFLWF